MAISKKLRQEVYEKFNGLCAYTGKPLGNDWQVDHVQSKSQNEWIGKGYEKQGCLFLENVDCIENLLPALRIINHYKRGFDLEGFRNSMNTFHERLKKLPKKTSVPATENRIKYMNEVANHFGITTEKPFNGIFYFETLTTLLE